MQPNARWQTKQVRQALCLLLICCLGTIVATEKESEIESGLECARAILIWARAT